MIVVRNFYINHLRIVPIMMRVINMKQRCKWLYQENQGYFDCLIKCRLLNNEKRTEIVVLLVCAWIKLHS